MGAPLVELVRLPYGVVAPGYGGEGVRWSNLLHAPMGRFLAYMGVRWSNLLVFPMGMGPSTIGDPLAELVRRPYGVVSARYGRPGGRHCSSSLGGWFSPYGGSVGRTCSSSCRGVVWFWCVVGVFSACFRWLIRVCFGVFQACIMYLWLCFSFGFGVPGVLGCVLVLFMRSPGGF